MKFDMRGGHPGAPVAARHVGGDAPTRERCLATRVQPIRRRRTIA